MKKMNDYSEGIPTELPPPIPLDNTVPHAPNRPQVLNDAEKRLAIMNSLRYFPPKWHKELASEFLNELEEFLLPIIKNISQSFAIFFTAA